MDVTVWLSKSLFKIMYILYAGHKEAKMAVLFGPSHYVHVYVRTYFYTVAILVKNIL